MKKLTLIIFLAVLSGCAVNPVTGDRNFMLGTTSDDIKLGAQYYAPMLQSQGGEYDVDPVLTAYVSEIGNKVASFSGVDLPYEFTVLNSSVPNAWALPGGKIAINRGLLTEMQNEAELAAVLGHEVVHAAARHSAQQQAKGTLLQGAVLATSVVTANSDYGNLATGGASVAAQLVSTKYGRNAELESDRYGMRYMRDAGYDPQGAVTLQEAFVRLSEGRNQDWLSGLFASHPPSEERVRENRKRAKRMGAGGIVGEAPYQAAMQKTMAAKPAYDAYDDGRKALAEKDLEAALGHAVQALNLFPDEANFHALRGDIRLLQDRHGDALINYNRAINRRGNFFYYHLQRGLTHSKLGDTDNAEIDLERSLTMLPTAPAHYELGIIKKNRGAMPEAIEHFRVVAQAGGEIGQAANSELARLELNSKPGNYVASACSVGNSGQLIVSVRNDAPMDINGVAVQIEYTDNSGQRQAIRRNVGGRLKPGEIASSDTRLSPYNGQTCPVSVIAAEIAD
ncbi:MAG: M48 family metalloprotease [Pseudomonadota bacterium]